MKFKQWNTGICKLKFPLKCTCSNELSLVNHCSICEIDSISLCNYKGNNSVTNDPCGNDGKVFNLLIYNHCTDDIKQQNTGICKFKSNCYEDPANFDGGNCCKINRLCESKFKSDSSTCETDFIGICDDKDSVTNDQCGDDGKSYVQFLIYNHCKNDSWFTNGYCISGHVQDRIECSDAANITPIHNLHCSSVGLKLKYF
ncbi:hypothetical protein ACTA71_010109 [Dictyostelium dimigraforme]